jgi:hypothetical protein
VTIRGDLFVQAEEFATELTDLFHSCFRDAPTAVAELAEARIVVRPERPVPLYISGKQRATLEVRLRCELDSRGTWLAVETSSITLTATVDRTPVFRFEYFRRPQKVPSAHLQLHAHRGALSQLLAHAGHPKAHDMSALHFPLGGSRFRPCLEDVVQFLAEEFSFDVLSTWKTAVEAGRQRWREKQVKAVVRDWQTVAAEALCDLGFAVEPPAEGILSTPTKALHAW